MAVFSNDHFFEVLSWLPAKSICRSKPSCKTFLNMSEETLFSMKQAQNMLLLDDSCFFIQPEICQKFNSFIKIQSLPEKKSSSGVPADFPSLFPAESVRVLASSNGLAFCRYGRNNGVELCVTNPVTRKWLPIPTPTSVHEYPEFDINAVLDCTNKNFDLDEYKVFLIENPPEWSSCLDLKVYSPKEGVWKALEKSVFIGSRKMRVENPVFVHNILHFISDAFPYIDRKSRYFRPYIMAYSFESGESSMLRLPNDAKRGSHDESKSYGMAIFEWKKGKSLDNCICLARHKKSVFTIWVLEDYERTSWKRIMKRRVKAMGLKEEDPQVQGFRIMNGSCLIFATKKKIYGYDLSGENCGRLKEICAINEWENKVGFISHSDTLRPCGTGARNFPASVHSNIDNTGSYNWTSTYPSKAYS